jgi:hypothetical protein
VSYQAQVAAPTIALAATELLPRRGSLRIHVATHRTRQRESDNPWHQHRTFIAAGCPRSRQSSMKHLKPANTGCATDWIGAPFLSGHADPSEQEDCRSVSASMSAKQKTGFRFRKSVLDELKAIAEGPPRSPIRCTDSRRAVKRTRAENGARPCASPSPQPRAGPGQSKPH